MEGNGIGNATGRRIAKHIYKPDGTWIKSTYYVRDAQDNVLAVYDNWNVDSTSTQHFKVKERHLYGSKRLGVDNREIELIGADTLSPDTGYFNLLGLKYYELTNHGNSVLSVVSDKVEYVEDSTYWISADGINDYVGTGSTYDFGLTDELTIEAWVKTTDSSTPALIVSNYAPADDKGVHIYLVNGIPRFMGRAGHGTGNHTSIDGPFAVNDGEWHHLVGTVKVDHYKLFVDGVKVAESTPTFTTADFTGARDFRVARAIHAAYYIDAEIREASLWKRAKTESEVASNLFQEYSPNDSGLVHYWKLNDNNNTAVNQVNGAPDGTLFGGVAWLDSYEGSYYRPEIISSTDYSPFLVRLDNRSFNTSEYRYSGQGQEHDDNIKGEGNSLNYTYRMHDPRLGRFFAVDPLVKEFPWNSPYAFSENRVIDCFEFEGMEAVSFNKDLIDADIASDVLKIFKNNQYLHKQTFGREGASEKVKTNHVVFATMKMESNRGGFTENITSKANKVFAGAEKAGKRVTISARIEADKSFNEISYIDRELLESYKSENTFAIVLNEQYVEEGNIEIIANTIAHEYIAHFSRDLEGVSKSGTEEHFDYFGIDRENPYGDKFYSDEEIDLILEKGNKDGKYKGRSVSPTRLKPGSTAFKVASEIKNELNKNNDEE